MTGAPHLRPTFRIVPPTPAQRRLFAVRINVLDGRMPYGRSRAFRLAPDELNELIDVATRLEARR